MTAHTWLGGAATLALLTIAACGGSSSSPTAPSEGPSFLIGT